tara:strand:+ start:208 stop:432 length:225 start_codon:yes stop_codon:yes gene_type:complete
MDRNYKNEYNAYHAKPTQKKRRAGRNAARRLMIKKVGRKTLEGKDVDHKDRNPHNNTRANLRIQSKRLNRSRNG